MNFPGGFRPRPNRTPALIALASLASLVLGSLGVLIWTSYNPEPKLPHGIDKLPELPAAPPIPDDPLELAFGTDRPDWNLAEFNVEETVNNPSVYANISKEEARKFNESLPFAPEVGPAARPFILPASTPIDRARALHCMSLAVYYEAGSESLNGQHAVAQVVINRMRHPAWPHSICGVVFQGSERKTGCQFTFTCDGALRKPPSGRRWRASQSVAYAALTGYVQADVGLATHYHTDWVAPKWAPTLKKLTKIGTHIFYTWKGKGGTPIAFTNTYAGKEAWPAKAAATAPELGAAEGEILSAAAAAALSQNPNDVSGLRGTSAGDFASQTQDPNQFSPTARALARAESLASQQASVDGGDSLEAATPFTLPEPGKDGLMPDPDIATLIPKPKIATNPSPLPQSAQTSPATAPLPQTRREAPKSRALDGL